MPSILVRHTVEDFDKWHPVFTEHASARKDHGSKGARLFRNAEKPNEITILMDWDSFDNARAFFASDTLRSAMQGGGVVGQPDVSFLNPVESAHV